MKFKKNRYFIQLSYNGTQYHGWQIQNNAITIQQVLNEKLSIVLQDDIYVVGAGRTDTGVHAEYYMAQFDIKTKIEDFKLFLNKINKLLPNDIAIQNIFSVNTDANTRFDAISRTYEYRITNIKDPFLTNFAWYNRLDFNVEGMNEAAKILFDYFDFTSFSKTDRFLRNMVRAIVGTLINVGRGKQSVNDMRIIIESKNRGNAGTSVPAQGLFLTEIEYPDELFIEKKDYI